MKFDAPVPISQLKSDLPQMTVWEECLNRNKCRCGLRGVQVMWKEDLETYTVRGSSWANEDTHSWFVRRVSLVLDTEGGEHIPAEEAVLLSFWPSPCCQPKVQNRFNTEGFNDQANH